jgi:hypothetical protein
MIYQIYYDDKIANVTQGKADCIQSFGVHKAKQSPRNALCLYDDEKRPNLTEHNTLCEWRVLYYVWKHHPAPWVGFTSWQHDQKGFFPPIEGIRVDWIDSTLKRAPITGFIVRPLHAVMVDNSGERLGRTLKDQFLQWSLLEHHIGKKINDKRSLPLGRYHTAPYWDFVMKAYHDMYAVNLEKELDWQGLGKVDALHTWCNAFVANWAYFDDYMTQFSPIALGLLHFFGSHPTDLELSYICERLIILHNYIRYSNNDFS